MQKYEKLEKIGEGKFYSLFYKVNISYPCYASIPVASSMANVNQIVRFLFSLVIPLKTIFNTPRIAFFLFSCFIRDKICQKISCLSEFTIIMLAW